MRIPAGNRQKDCRPRPGLSVRHAHERRVERRIGTLPVTVLPVGKDSSVRHDGCMVQPAGNRRDIPAVGDTALSEIVGADGADPSARQNPHGVRNAASQQAAYPAGTVRIIRPGIPPGQQAVPDTGAEQADSLHRFRREFTAPDVYPQTAVRQHEYGAVPCPCHGADAAQGVQNSASPAGMQNPPVGAQPQRHVRQCDCLQNPPPAAHLALSRCIPPGCQHMTVRTQSDRMGSRRGRRHNLCPVSGIALPFPVVPGRGQPAVGRQMQENTPVLPGLCPADNPVFLPHEPVPVIQPAVGSIRCKQGQRVRIGLKAGCQPVGGVPQLRRIAEPAVCLRECRPGIRPAAPGLVRHGVGASGASHIENGVAVILPQVAERGKGHRTAALPVGVLPAGQNLPAVGQGSRMVAPTANGKQMTPAAHRASGPAVRADRTDRASGRPDIHLPGGDGSPVRTQSHRAGVAAGNRHNLPPVRDPALPA